MTAQLCTRSASHARWPILGLCLEESCEATPLACRLCASDFHQGHLIVTYAHMT